MATSPGDLQTIRREVEAFESRLERAGKLVPRRGGTGNALIKQSGADGDIGWGEVATTLSLEDLDDVALTTGLSSGQHLEYTGTNGWTNTDPSDPAKLTTILDFFNGAFVETIDIDVVETTAGVVLQLEQSGGGDLQIFFGGELVTLDCTPVAEVGLTEGTDEVHQLNYVYVIETTAGATLTASTSGWPTTPHAPVATVVVQTAASLGTDGAMKVHAWTDHLSSSSENGHAAHLNKKLRSLQATWTSGVAPSDLTSDQISTTEGVVFQLHNHTMPALDMGSTAADPVWVRNDPDSAYTRLTDFGNGGIDKLSDGTGLINNRYINIILWGVVSEKPEDCKLFINLPNEQYASQADGDADVNNSADYTIPSEFVGCGFLIARYTWQYSSVGGGTFTQSQKVDLRGLTPSTAPGGGSASGDVIGPASATDEAIARYDGATGKVIQNSSATVSDSGGLTCNNLTSTLGVATDDVFENTLNHGVDIDGVSLKDGLVDGRDVATDGTKLDTIPAAGGSNAILYAAGVGDYDLTADFSDLSPRLTPDSGDHVLISHEDGATGVLSLTLGDLPYPVDSVNTQTGAVVLDADDISDAATTNKFTSAADIAKLAGIEAGATADQTGAEIKALYEVEANAFTDAQFTKLAGIEAGATADQTGAEIKALYEVEANAFTDAQFTKLAGIEAGAEVNDVDSVNTQTGAVVLDPDDLDDAATAHKFTSAADISKLAGIEASADVTDATNVAAAGAMMDSDAAITVDTIDEQTGAAGVTIETVLIKDGNVDGRDVSVDGAKLDGIEAGASADMSDAEIKTAYENNADTNEFSDAEQTKLAGIETSADVTDTANVDAAGAVMDSDTSISVDTVAESTPAAGVTIDGTLIKDGDVDGRDVSVDGTKLDGIEAGATGDMSDAEIKTAYENNADTNAFTDADHTKLDGIEASATADQTGAEIKVAYEGELDTNAFTDADHTKLDGIEAGAEVNTVDSVFGRTGAVTAQTNDYWGSEINNDSGVAGLNVTACLNALNSEHADFVTGPASATDTEIALFDKATGKVIMGGGATIDGSQNLALSGTVDGRDIATDGSKLDGIEAGAEANDVDSVNTQTGAVVLDADDISDAATTNKFTTAAEITKLSGIETAADVTDATNVNAAGATMNTDTDVSSNSYVLDEDDMASDSATKVATQQSIKAYVDDNVPRVLYQTGVEIAKSNSTAEWTVFTYTVPANTIGANSTVRFVFKFAYENLTFGVRSMFVKVTWGGTTIWRDVTIQLGSTGEAQDGWIIFEIANQNSTSSQVCGGHFLQNDENVAPTTGHGDSPPSGAESNNYICPASDQSKDTTSAQTFTITFDMTTANASHSFTGKGGYALLIP